MDLTFIPQWYMALTGFIIPPIMNQLINASMTRRKKSWIAFGISFVIGIGGAYFGGRIDFSNLLATAENLGTNLVLIFSVSQGFYDQWFKSKI